MPWWSEGIAVGVTLFATVWLLVHASPCGQKCKRRETP